MRWAIAILISLIAAPALGQGEPSLASVPAASSTEGFRSADVEGLTFRYFCRGTGSPTVPHPHQLQRMNAVLPPRRDNEPEVLRGFRDGPDRGGMGGEWFDFARNAEQFANRMHIGGIPLIVLTAAPQPPNDQSPLPREWQAAIEPIHQQLQRELANVSTDSKHIVAQRAGHNIQLDEPQLVLDAITDLVTRSRAKL